jgi:hypothetical protein
MNRRLLPLLFVLVSVVLLVASCGKKSKPVTATILEPGKGAVMVVFPSPRDFSAENWWAQINLEGEADTRLLPRMPFADLKSIMVYNIPPGRYKIIASSGMKKNPPMFGGALDSLFVRAGELQVLGGHALGQASYPIDRIPLDFVSRSPWILESPNGLHDFIAENADDFTNQ